VWWSCFDTYFSTCIKFSKFSIFINLALTFYLQAEYFFLELYHYSLFARIFQKFVICDIIGVKPKNVRPQEDWFDPERVHFVL